MPADAACRELAEETGISQVELRDCEHSVEFAISSRWRSRYAEDVTRNREHLFLCALPERQTITLCPEEHTEYVWLGYKQARDKATSATNRSAIERFVMDKQGP